MSERDHTMLKRLLDRLLATRARRDREVRFSDSWRAADDELHAIERAIFRAPLEPLHGAAGHAAGHARGSSRRQVTPRNAPAS